MKEVYNNNPLSEVSEIKDGLLNISIFYPPDFEDRESKIVYGWKIEEDYWVWIKGLLDVIKKKLRKQGLLIFIGKVSIKMLNEIVNKGFNLKKQFIWDNGRIKNIFVFIRNSKNEVKTLLKYYQDLHKISSKKINSILGVNTGGGGYWSIYTGNNKNLQIPSLNHWEKLQDLFKIDINYEDLLCEYVDNKEEIWRGNQDLLYEKIIGLNRKKDVLVWELFGGTLNGINYYEKQNINYVVYEYDKRKYYKLLSKIEKN